ncbi:hypothetical protein CBR_g48693 [Chara braunii]|uniref:Uncharacterized protein n=1 Tax=Chara braunii TaxID=69332 RepID=A0A388K4H6_CHABU|nr:hypothetical protein CBR_g48693 [Chara braunii]|eukprot:GBG64945.1 hypothetical protein CBR_g48693 [Chara braunii]
MKKRSSKLFGIAFGGSKPAPQSSVPPHPNPPVLQANPPGPQVHPPSPQGHTSSPQGHPDSQVHPSEQGQRGTSDQMSSGAFIRGKPITDSFQDTQERGSSLPDYDVSKPPPAPARYHRQCSIDITSFRRDVIPPPKDMPAVPVELVANLPNVTERNPMGVFPSSAHPLEGTKQRAKRDLKSPESRPEDFRRPEGDAPAFEQHKEERDERSRREAATMRPTPSQQAPRDLTQIRQDLYGTGASMEEEEEEEERERMERSQQQAATREPKSSNYQPEDFRRTERDPRGFQNIREVESFEKRQPQAAATRERKPSMHQYEDISPVEGDPRGSDQHREEDRVWRSNQPAAVREHKPRKHYDEEEFKRTEEGGPHGFDQQWEEDMFERSKRQAPEREQNPRRSQDEELRRREEGPHGFQQCREAKRLQRPQQQAATRESERSNHPPRDFVHMEEYEPRDLRRREGDRGEFEQPRDERFETSQQQAATRERKLSLHQPDDSRWEGETRTRQQHMEEKRPERLKQHPGRRASDYEYQNEGSEGREGRPRGFAEGRGEETFESSQQQAARMKAKSPQCQPGPRGFEQHREEERVEGREGRRRGSAKEWEEEPFERSQQQAAREKGKSPKYRSTDSRWMEDEPHGFEQKREEERVEGRERSRRGSAKEWEEEPFERSQQQAARIKGKSPKFRSTDSIWMEDEPDGFEQNREEERVECSQQHTATRERKSSSMHQPEDSGWNGDTCAREQHMEGKRPERSKQQEARSGSDPNKYQHEDIGGREGISRRSAKEWEEEPFERSHEQAARVRAMSPKYRSTDSRWMEDEPHGFEQNRDEERVEHSQQHTATRERKSSSMHQPEDSTWKGDTRAHEQHMEGKRPGKSKQQAARSGFDSNRYRHEDIGRREVDPHGIAKEMEEGTPETLQQQAAIMEPKSPTCQPTVLEEETSESSQQQAARVGEGPRGFEQHSEEESVNIAQQQATTKDPGYAKYQPEQHRREESVERSQRMQERQQQNGTGTDPPGMEQQHQDKGSQEKTESRVNKSMDDDETRQAASTERERRRQKKTVGSKEDESSDDHFMDYAAGKAAVAAAAKAAVAAAECAANAARAAAELAIKLGEQTTQGPSTDGRGAEQQVVYEEAKEITTKTDTMRSADQPSLDARDYINVEEANGVSERRTNVAKRVEQIEKNVVLMDLGDGKSDVDKGTSSSPAQAADQGQHPGNDLQDGQLVSRRARQEARSGEHTSGRGRWHENQLGDNVVDLGDHKVGVNKGTSSSLASAADGSRQPGNDLQDEQLLSRQAGHGTRSGEHASGQGRWHENRLGDNGQISGQAGWQARSGDRRAEDPKGQDNRTGRGTVPASQNPMRSNELEIPKAVEQDGGSAPVDERYPPHHPVPEHLSRSASVDERYPAHHPVPEHLSGKAILHPSSEQTLQAGIKTHDHPMSSSAIRSASPRREGRERVVSVSVRTRHASPLSGCRSPKAADESTDHGVQTPGDNRGKHAAGSQRPFNQEEQKDEMQQFTDTGKKDITEEAQQPTDPPEDTKETRHPADLPKDIAGRQTQNFVVTSTWDVRTGTHESINLVLPPCHPEKRILPGMPPLFYPGKPEKAGAQKSKKDEQQTDLQKDIKGTVENFVVTSTWDVRTGTHESINLVLPPCRPEKRILPGRQPPLSYPGKPEKAGAQKSKKDEQQTDLQKDIKGTVENFVVTSAWDTRTGTYESINLVLPICGRGKYIAGRQTLSDQGKEETDPQNSLEYGKDPAEMQRHPSSQEEQHAEARQSAEEEKDPPGMQQPIFVANPVCDDLTGSSYERTNVIPGMTAYDPGQYAANIQLRIGEGKKKAETGEQSSDAGQDVAEGQQSNVAVTATHESLTDSHINDSTTTFTGSYGDVRAISAMSTRVLRTYPGDHNPCAHIQEALPDRVKKNMEAQLQTDPIQHSNFRATSNWDSDEEDEDD